jgi:hypothetical protein
MFNNHISFSDHYGNWKMLLNLIKIIRGVMVDKINNGPNYENETIHSSSVQW